MDDLQRNVTELGIGAALVYVTWWSIWGYRQTARRHRRSSEWLPDLHEQEVDFVPLPPLDPKRRELTTRFGESDHVATGVHSREYRSDSGHLLRQSLV